MADSDNIAVGKRDTSTDKPAHTAGVREGNWPAGGQGEPWLRSEGHGRSGRGTAERSTGINPDKRNPIDSRMPNLSPA
jgi:hypothetical protein